MHSGPASEHSAPIGHANEEHLDEMSREAFEGHPMHSPVPAQRFIGTGSGCPVEVIGTNPLLFPVAGGQGGRWHGAPDLLLGSQLPGFRLGLERPPRLRAGAFCLGQKQM